MPFAKTDDGVNLYYEETGEGFPLLFIHEFAGDHRSWEPQVRHFARRYRCVTYNARGYPPSEVPEDVGAYSQQRAVDDARSILDHLGVEQAHIAGLSMGGFCTLHFGLRYPARARSLVSPGVDTAPSPSGSRASAPRACPPRTRSSIRASTPWWRSTRSARRASSSRTRTRGAGRSSGATSASTRRWARP